MLTAGLRSCLRRIRQLGSHGQDKHNRRLHEAPRSKGRTQASFGDRPSFSADTLSSTAALRSVIEREQSSRGAVVLVGAGSARHRTAAVPAGHERSRRMKELQMAEPSDPAPRPPTQDGSGFESHLTASQARGDRTQKVRSRDDASQHRRCGAPVGRRIGLRDGGLLPICCLGRAIQGRPRPNWASDLGWS
jgi:hypothetical protein